jgi:membrane protease YdiL (CAAX protease family)
VAAPHLGVHHPARLIDGSPYPRASRRDIAEEIVVVLSLSLLASAVFAIIDLTTAPLRGQTRLIYPVAPFVTQLASILFGLAPVWLVLYLNRRSGEPISALGLQTTTIGQDVLFGMALAAAVGSVGILLYLGSVQLGLNRCVIPVPPLGHWWTIPILVLGAIQAGLLEEIVDVGFLIPKLQQLSLTGAAAVGISALLRGSYHLYQGWGGFIGNLLLGVLFGAIFLRWRRTWPLIVAHTLLDLGAGLGYIAFRSHLPGC